MFSIACRVWHLLNQQEEVEARYLRGEQVFLAHWMGLVQADREIQEQGKDMDIERPIAKEMVLIIVSDGFLSYYQEIAERRELGPLVPPVISMAARMTILLARYVLALLILGY